MYIVIIVGGVAWLLCGCVSRLFLRVHAGNVRRDPVWELTENALLLLLILSMCST